MGSAVIFLEASIEPIPSSIRNHPSVIADARRRGKNPSEILLDDSKHHSAMRNLDHREKRGRPDIIHQCLLLLLDSEVAVEVFVHTIAGDVIWINRETRLPRNLNRFVGLMEDLLVKRKITAGGKTLIEVTDLGLEDVVAGRRTILLKEDGRREALGKYLTGDFAVCIGAFPHGDLFPDTLKALEPYEIVSLGPKSYTSLYVTAKVICEYERVRVAEDS